MREKTVTLDQIARLTGKEDKKSGLRQRLVNYGVGKLGWGEYEEAGVKKFLIEKLGFREADISFPERERPAPTPKLTRREVIETYGLDNSIATLGRTALGLALIYRRPEDAGGILSQLGYTSQEISKIRRTSEISPGASPTSRYICTADIAKIVGEQWDSAKHRLFSFDLQIGNRGIIRESFECVLYRMFGSEAAGKMITSGLYTETEERKAHDRYLERRRATDKLEFHLTERYTKEDLHYLGLQKADADSLTERMDGEDDMAGVSIIETLISERRKGPLRILGYTGRWKEIESRLGKERTVYEM